MRWGSMAAIGAGAGLGALLLRRRNRLSPGRRTVLITGGSRGLGLVLAREFGARGARVAICARDRRELAAAAHDLRRRGVRAMTVRADVADRGDVREMVTAVARRFGPVDFLVNNAGIIQVGPVSMMTRADFDEAMGVMYEGVLNTTMAVLPGMLERRRGRIVNITSIGGLVPVPHLLPYTCAKFAAVGLSRGLTAELEGTGVRVTTVAPGLMRTGSAAHARFKGAAPSEFAWFALASATPLTAMSARRAARRIVRAAARGERFVVLTWQARLLRLAHDLLPTATSAALGAVNRLLPGADDALGFAPEDGQESDSPELEGDARGMRITHLLAPSPLTAMANRAARRNNEYGGTPKPSMRHARRAGVRNPDGGMSRRDLPPAAGRSAES